MALFPATVSIDFYIQADSKEEAEQKLQNIMDENAFTHDDLEYPEIEQPEYANGRVLDSENQEDQEESISSLMHNEVMLDIAINTNYVDLKIKFEFDSRLLIRAMILWADEFIAIHKHTDWDETDYFLTLDAFANEKLKQFTEQLKSL